MTVIAWDPRFTVGHENIDAQHRVLFDLMAKAYTTLHGRFQAGDTNSERFITDLVHVLTDHFRFENTLMRERAYPEYESHRAYHMRMLTTVDEVMERWLLGEDAVTAFDEFLKQWYYHHTSGADLNLGKWLDLNPG
jgi:hemerythrin